ncbi:hypothetical protein B0H67DRAFT_106625 [Lasiosphaeris hirsuta]|uniref:2EXR domain-containing protein n=1 Tax=Lasiosphaeris hirsuta TaxID=260670 RepID=A0AA40E5A2_9PEZI|nr:hypothetical protein B0H67DRAFT_106625 [Lasiosphaeris hirsuta]
MSDCSCGGHSGHSGHPDEGEDEHHGLVVFDGSDSESESDSHSHPHPHPHSAPADAEDHSDHAGASAHGDEADESEDPDDGDEEEDDEDDEHNGFFDMEASESNESIDGDGSDDGTNLAHDDGSDFDTDSDAGDRELYFFPQFKRLPPELRLRIWELFCPDLTAEGRVYRFYYELSLRIGREYPKPHFLYKHTAAARMVLATHRESRHFALQALPDTLAVPCSPINNGFNASRGRNEYTPRTRGVIRFNKKKDIVLLELHWSRPDLGHLEFRKDSWAPRYPGFSDQIENLGLSVGLCNSQSMIPHPGASAFYPNLKAVYGLIDHTQSSTHNLTWCASDKVNFSPVTVLRERLGHITKEFPQQYCWPNIDAHLDWAKSELPLYRLWKLTPLPEYEFSGQTVSGQLSELPVWPLVEFNNDEGMERLDGIIARGPDHGDLDLPSDYEDADAADGSSDADADGYESSGIDDSLMDDSDESSADEDDLAVLDNTFDDGNVDGLTDGDGSDVEILSPSRGEAEIIALTGDGEMPAANFSSPEPETATLDEESDGDDTGPVPAPRANLKRSRARVVESDDESENEAPKKRVRRAVEPNDESGDEAPKKLARRVVDSDDESEDEAPKKRVRYVQVQESDSESNSEVEEAPKKRVRYPQPEDDEESESSSESEDSDEDSENEGAEEPIAKPLSLAEKLQLHRRENPVSDSDENQDSDAEEAGGLGDDYDVDNYARYPDDDEGGGDEEDEEIGDEEELMQMEEEQSDDEF